VRQSPSLTVHRDSSPQKRFTRLSSDAIDLKEGRRLSSSSNEDVKPPLYKAPAGYTISACTPSDLSRKVVDLPLNRDQQPVVRRNKLCSSAAINEYCTSVKTEEHSIISEKDLHNIVVDPSSVSKDLQIIRLSSSAAPSPVTRSNSLDTVKSEPISSVSSYCDFVCVKEEWEDLSLKPSPHTSITPVAGHTRYRAASADVADTTRAATPYTKPVTPATPYIKPSTPYIEPKLIIDYQEATREGLATAQSPDSSSPLPLLSSAAPVCSGSNSTAPVCSGGNSNSTAGNRSSNKRKNSQHHTEPCPPQHREDQACEDLLSSLEDSSGPLTELSALLSSLPDRPVALRVCQLVRALVLHPPKRPRQDSGGCEEGLEQKDLEETVQRIASDRELKRFNSAGASVDQIDPSRTISVGSSHDFSSTSNDFMRDSRFDDSREDNVNLNRASSSERVNSSTESHPKECATSEVEISRKVEETLCRVASDKSIGEDILVKQLANTYNKVEPKPNNNKSEDHKIIGDDISVSKINSNCVKENSCGDNMKKCKSSPMEDDSSVKAEPSPMAGDLRTNRDKLDLDTSARCSEAKLELGASARCAKLQVLASSGGSGTTWESDRDCRLECDGDKLKSKTSGSHANTRNVIRSCKENVSFVGKLTNGGEANATTNEDEPAGVSGSEDSSAALTDSSSQAASKSQLKAQVRSLQRQVLLLRGVCRHSFKQSFKRSFRRRKPHARLLLRPNGGVGPPLSSLKDSSPKLNGGRSLRPSEPNGDVSIRSHGRLTPPKQALSVKANGIESAKNINGANGRDSLRVNGSAALRHRRPFPMSQPALVHLRGRSGRRPQSLTADNSADSASAAKGTDTGCESGKGPCGGFQRIQQNGRKVNGFQPAEGSEEECHGARVGLKNLTNCSSKRNGLELSANRPLANKQSRF